MELIVNGQFYRDLSNFSNRSLLEEINRAIVNVEKAQHKNQIQNLVKLRKFQVHYRIEVAKHYRIGIIIRNNKVWFLRFGHRNNFYKKIFP